MTAAATSDPKMLIAQTKLAFDLLQRLYDECAMLVRELELLLHREPELFVIGKPAGYGVSTRGSTGLDPMNVQLWPMRKFGVFFAPEASVTLEGGQSRTSFDVRVLYMRFILDDYASAKLNGKPLQEPSVIYGVFTEILPKKGFKKLEQLLAHIEYNDVGVFARLPVVQYEDAYIRLEGIFGKVSLFDLGDAAAVAERLASPAVELYRTIVPGPSSALRTQPVEGE